MSERTIYFPNGTYLTTAIWNFASSDAYFMFRDDALFLMDKWRQKSRPDEELWYERKKKDLKSLFTHKESGLCEVDPEKLLFDIWHAGKDCPPGDVRGTFWGHYTFGECKDGKKSMLVLLKACMQWTAAEDRGKTPKESFIFVDNFSYVIGDVPC